MQSWSTYFATLGGAAATLLGLLFVAVSVNVGAALRSPSHLTRDIAEQAFQNYLAVMLVALLALFPNLETWLFGAICLSATAARVLWLAVRLVRTVRLPQARRPKFDALRRHLATVIGFALLTVASTRMTLGWGQNFNMLAAATLVLMLSATSAAWDLLRQIAAQTTP